MTVGDVQLFVSSAIGGAMVGETVEGVARYPINIRYPQDYRNSPQALETDADPDPDEAADHAGRCRGY
ncbi:hypothetical protein LNO89_30430 [Klebsiella pneumoniae subsp. pneumoniae]|nr:hypothetical protein [Klebsiella pneumoniae subsp. pneumoniae]